jgi:hypothetical protein
MIGCYAATQLHVGSALSSTVCKTNSSHSLATYSLYHHDTQTKTFNNLFSVCYTSCVKIYFKHNRHSMYKCDTELCLHNQCCRERAIHITYFDCVSVALVTQHTEHMHHITLSAVALLALPPHTIS